MEQAEAETNHRVTVRARHRYIATAIAGIAVSMAISTTMADNINTCEPATM